MMGHRCQNIENIEVLLSIIDCFNIDIGLIDVDVLLYTEMSWEIAKVMYLISSDFPQRALLRNALGN